MHSTYQASMTDMAKQEQQLLTISLNLRTNQASPQDDEEKATESRSGGGHAGAVTDMRVIRSMNSQL